MNSIMKPKPVRAIQDFRHAVRVPSYNVSGLPDALFLQSRLNLHIPAQRRFAIKINFRHQGEIHAKAVKITHR